jgi:uncharacterized protein
MQSWMPLAEKITFEINSMRGNWLDQMEVRIPGAIFMQTMFFFIFSFWRVMAMMLLGMALFKWGVLSAQRSKGFYVRMASIGLVLGYIIVAAGVWKNFEAGWTMDYSMFIGSQFNYVGSLSVALGYIGLIMLISKADIWAGCKRTFAAVGKMAFTNYILMSVLGLFIFTGSGFALFGQVERWIQILIVIAIWALLLIISPVWLKHYRYGPLEWLWRSLTYWHRQKFAKNTEG